MTDPRMLVVLPLRGRRELTARCLETFAATTDTAALLAVIDDDDTATYDGLEYPPGTQVQVIPRMPLAAKINHVTVPLAARYDAIIIVGNDHTFDTPHWDTILLGAMDGIGGSGIVYPDDKRRHDNAEISLISTDIIQALGWFCEPTLHHYWADNVISDIGRHAGCLLYCPEAVVEHHHYSRDPSTPFDETYAYGESFGTQDYQAYQAWRRTRMRDDVETVKKVLAAKGAGFKLTMRGASERSAGHGADAGPAGAVRQAAGVVPGDH